MLLTPPLFHPVFEVFSLDQIATVGVGVNLSMYLKLIGLEIVF